jgi:hypothetical protein
MPVRQHARRPLALALAAALLATAAGCDGPPATGTTVSPINPEQAARQNKAMQD